MLDHYQMSVPIDASSRVSGAIIIFFRSGKRTHALQMTIASLRRGCTCKSPISKGMQLHSRLGTHQNYICPLNYNIGHKKRCICDRSLVLWQAIGIGYQRNADKRSETCDLRRDVKGRKSETQTRCHKHDPSGAAAKASMSADPDQYYHVDNVSGSRT